MFLNNLVVKKIKNVLFLTIIIVFAHKFNNLKIYKIIWKFVWFTIMQELRNCELKVKNIFIVPNLGPGNVFYLSYLDNWNQTKLFCQPLEGIYFDLGFVCPDLL
jgi:hypothetical protein